MVCAIHVIAAMSFGSGPSTTRVVEPLVRVVDVAIGEATEVVLHDGTRVTINLLDVQERRDSVMNAVWEACATVLINGRDRVTLVSGMYRLPVSVGGVQIDCPVTRGYRERSHIDHWGLMKDARLRLWPAGSPLIRPGTFVYPIRQRWFASATWFSNEPVSRQGEKVYYHAGMDFGGVEGLTEVVCATDGTVISVGDRLCGDRNDHPPVAPRYDVVYIKDARGWYYRYSHLHSLATALQPGKPIQAGQLIGQVGKEGASGGWAHLHFEIKSLQPSGQWGTQDSYGFLWEAYQRQYEPKLLAVARPRHLLTVGETTTLDGSRSWAKAGIASYQWTFSDGTTTRASKVQRRYDRPGQYSEILQITDREGRVDYDFAIVRVVGDDAKIPSIHAAYEPTFGIQPGDPVTFKVRAFNATTGVDCWDFGDGSPPVETRSNVDASPLAPNGYAAVVHRFARAGRYIVRVRRATEVAPATTHLLVRVGMEE